MVVQWDVQEPPPHLYLTIDKIEPSYLTYDDIAWILSSSMKKNKEYSFLNTFIRLETGEFVQIARMPNLDALLDGQVTGLEWLDSVDHLLDRYESDSRTEAFSGFVI